MQKTILITGGAGYIGSHSVVAFEQAGYKTVIIDDFSNTSDYNLFGISEILGYDVDFYECNIADTEKLTRIFEKYSFDGVLHFAGWKAVGESCENPIGYFKNNISGTISLLEVMKKFSVKKFIFSSSATVYDEKNIPPFTEQNCCQTSNPYGTTKFVIEKLLEDLTKFDGWEVTSLRYFNPIGSHISAKIGEIPNGVPNNLLPYIFRVATGELRELAIFGNDYPTHDGTGIRDYIDVNDLTDAHILAYENLRPNYDIYNVGTGQGTSVLEIVRIAEKMIGKQIPYRIAPRRSGDIAEVYASPQKIIDTLGWQPRNTVSDAISLGWKFIQNYQK